MSASARARILIRAWRAIRVGDERRAVAFWQGGIEDLGADVVRDLARRQARRNRPPPTITDGMQLGVQPAFRAADMAGKYPLLTGSMPCGEL